MQNKVTKLSYRSFTLEMIRKRYNIHLHLQNLFKDISPSAPSNHLLTWLKRASDLSLSSEKSRSEFIVAPILLEVRELLNNSVSIYSGIRLDVAQEEGLQGICDFIISKSEPLPTIQCPILMLVEAKKNDIEEGLGQCAAEMIAAQRLNQEENSNDATVYGCVTTGELWQFLKLTEQSLFIDQSKIYFEHIDRILGVFINILSS